MIVQTLSTWDIADLLLADEGANWSRPGSLAMAEWLEEVSDESDTPQEFDLIAVRCDFSEYPALRDWLTCFYQEPDKDAMKSAGIDLDGTESDEEIDDLIRSHINDRGVLIEFTGGVIVSEF